MTGQPGASDGNNGAGNADGADARMTAATISPDELSDRANSGTGAAPGTARARSDAPSGRRRRLRCLITNDDGIESEGLRRLALVAAEAGMQVVLAGPLRDSSGASASITAAEEDGRFVVEKRSLPGLEEHEVYGVGALPAFIALTAIRGAFGDPPDLVLSGINNGPNTGHAILHSGTVGAALTAAAHGTSSLAVSLGIGGEPTWDAAAAVTAQILPGLIDAPAGTALNLNVPNLRPEQVRGIRRAPLASFGAVQTNILESGGGYVKIGVSDIDTSSEPGSDAALLAAGWATITALRPVCQAPDVDLPGVIDGSADEARAAEAEAR